MKFKHFPSPALTVCAASISHGLGALCWRGTGPRVQADLGEGVLPSVPSWEPGSWRVEERCLRG